MIDPKNCMWWHCRDGTVKGCLPKELKLKSAYGSERVWVIYTEKPLSFFGKMVSLFSALNLLLKGKEARWEKCFLVEHEVSGRDISFNYSGLPDPQEQICVSEAATLSGDVLIGKGSDEKVPTGAPDFSAYIQNLNPNYTIRHAKPDYLDPEGHATAKPGEPEPQKEETK